ncbi:hypothetical protein ABNG03_04265 [Halorubrum sp. RMP-47]|uniref:HTH iclR-type domain-containing protein n=1 Tax=Halorubrum miltondacostae TaxID=3076378 RepID=A0ABD5M606_9EURY
MRNPAIRALLIAVVALALVASAGGAVNGASTVPSPLHADDTVAHTSAAAAEAPVRGSVDDRLTAARPQTEDVITSPSATRIRVGLNPDRSADWTVAVRYSLADENETATFRTVGDRFRDGEVGPDVELFEGFRREANRNVDRSMAIEGVDREFDVHEDPSEFDVATDDAAAVGELRLTFTWTAFLAQDGENLVLGDALTTPENGTWLRSLGADQTLEVRTPEGYTVTSTPSTAVTQLSDGDVIIEGPQTFNGGEPVAIVYGPAGAASPPWGMFLAAIVLAAVLVAGSVVGYRRVSAEGGAPGDPIANGEGNAPADTERRSADDPNAGEMEDPGAADESADGEGGEPDLSLLSDEERVERLLGENGGRMRQADIVAETGWSDAKVSQLLSAMADEKRVEKLRLGRENLISLPDDEEAEAGGDEGGDADGRDVGR